MHTPPGASTLAIVVITHLIERAVGLSEAFHHPRRGGEGRAQHVASARAEHLQQACVVEICSSGGQVYKTKVSCSQTLYAVVDDDFIHST